MRPLLFLALWLAASIQANAQIADGRFSIDAWGAGQGLLPDDSVLALAQTHDGYLWIGTLNGMVRFDGLRFTVFDESNTTNLPSSEIRRLFEDSRGRLWVGTSTAGAALISEGRVEPLKIGRGLRQGHLVSMCEDSAGAVWMLTEDGQLGRYAGGVIDEWNLGAGAGESIIADKSGTLWIGAGARIFGVDPLAVRSGAPLPAKPGPEVRQQLDFLLASRAGGYWRLADGVIRKYSGTQPEGAGWPYPWTNGIDTVKAACEDLNGNLIVGTGGPLQQGVFWFDAQGRFTRICGTNGLTSDSVYALQADAEGDLWAGLEGGGLNRVRPKVFRTLESFNNSVAQSVSPDNQGGVWISIKDRDFNYWKDGRLQNFHAASPLPPDIISRLNPTAVLVDQQQQVWAVARPRYGSGLFRLDGGFFHSVDVPLYTPEMSVLFSSRSSGLWIGTAGGLGHWDGARLDLLTTNDGLSANDIHAIAEDREGSLWIGTELGGLNKLQAGRFTSFRRSGGFVSDNISSLYVDSQDVLWIGTMGNGLIRWRNGQAAHYWTENGLIANSIDYMVEDDEGCLWIGSDAGLMRVHKSDLNDFADGAISSVFCRGYDKRDGLPSAECTFGSQPAACRAGDGTLWFPTHAGVVYVNPAGIHSNTIPPPVVIEQVLAEGKEQNAGGPHVAPLANLTLAPGKAELEIHYTSLNLGAADRARFSYRLSRTDRSPVRWGDAHGRRYVRYEALPPGPYLFEVKACNEDGVWNETPARLAITILPFFWQTGAFRALAAAVLLGLVAAAVYFISTEKLHRQVAGLRQQQALEKERARIARDIHDQVGASLTQLALLGELVEADKDDPQEAAEHARQISQSARDTTRALDEIVWTVNPSNDTLEGLINYICKHAQEYLAVGGLRYRLDIPAQLPLSDISPETRHNVFLAAKEAVTNIVKHSGASEAAIRMKLEPGFFTLEIQDNGRGPAGVKAKAAESRNGLRNMRKRMEDVGGRFSIEPAPQGGTIVGLTVPLARKP
ncbi:MAG TPA: two-component regulator propeller domain-containing protein [Verrucomicrobiae bacterium]|jgi:signal transduction histidine kinase/ligand-binding sensor domain-containing protein